MKKIVGLSLALVSASVALASQVSAAEISQQQVTKDITYLASDELKGRANFSPEITEAAAFIGQRFKDAGLVPLDGLSGYEQPFSIFNIAPKSIELSLNGSKVSEKNVAVATAHSALDWQDASQLTVKVIGKDDKFRQVLSQLNSVGGNTVVLVDLAHQEMFARYQQYFAGGLNKFESNQGDSLVIVLTDVTKLDSIAFSSKSEIKQQKLANVVGVLPGKSKEMVLFSAHYDHLGVDDSKEGDQIYNGADDDASGTSAVINLASYYAAQGKPQRTLVFSAFTAEEIGGYGSRYFSTHIDADKIAAMVNIEMIGKPSKFGAGSFWMTGFDRSNLGELMNKSLKGINQQVYPDPYPKQNLFYRSDNATLARLGVPAHSFSSTQLDKDKHYHQETDDIASLDLTSMTQVIKAIAIGSQGLVDGKATPTRVDTSKVKSGGKFY